MLNARQPSYRTVAQVWLHKIVSKLSASHCVRVCMFVCAFSFRLAIARSHSVTRCYQIRTQTIERGGLLWIQPKKKKRKRRKIWRSPYKIHKSIICCTFLPIHVVCALARAFLCMRSCTMYIYIYLPLCHTHNIRKELSSNVKEARSEEQNI